MIDLLEQALSTGVVCDEHGVEHRPGDTSVTRMQCELLQHFAYTTNASLSIETGCAYGISALAITSAIAKKDNSKHIAIDPFQKTAWKNCGRQLLKSAGLEEHFECIGKRAEYVLPTFCEKQMTIDLAFIDSYHTFDSTLMEFIFIDRLLRVDGIVIVDDVWMPSIQRVVSFIKNNMDYVEVEPVATAKAAIAAFKKRGKDKRAWDHYIDF